MQKEKLIEEVRKHPILYDVADPKYGDIERKEKVWRDIAKTLSQSVSVCKKMWLNLRECHRRAIKKKKTVSGQSTSTVKKWQYENEMSFLLPHYKGRSAATSGNTKSFEPNDDGDDENSLSTVENFPYDNDSQHSSLTGERPESGGSMDELPKLFPNTPKTKRKKPEENSTAVLLRYLLENKKAEEQNQQDDIEKFFSSISATVKKLTPYNQAVLKSKIFNLVSDAEISEINDRKQNQNGLYDLLAPGTSGLSTLKPNTSTSTTAIWVQESEETVEESKVDALTEI